MSKVASQKANWKTQCGRGLASNFAVAVVVVGGGGGSVVAVGILLDLFLISFAANLRLIKIKF